MPPFSSDRRAPPWASELVKLPWLVDSLTRKIDNMAITVTQLQADIAAQTTITASAVTLIQGMQSQIQEWQQNGGATPDQLAALDQQITANTSALAAAVSANTPAAPAAGGTGAAGGTSAAGGATGATGATGQTGS